MGGSVVEGGTAADHGADGGSAGALTEPSSPFSDQDLVRRCLSGDDRAWSSLLRRHAGQVFAIAYRSVGRRDEAEDLSQEIFWKISRMLDRYELSSPFKPWMLQVARNHLIDHHRSHRREKESTLELDAMPVMPGRTPAGQEGAVLRRERADAIRSGLGRLPRRLREAVVLRDVDGLDYSEIATVLAVPVGTVKSRINRGRLQLAEQLADQKDDLS